MSNVTQGGGGLEGGSGSGGVPGTPKRREVNVYKVKHVIRRKKENVLMSEAKTETDWDWVKSQRGEIVNGEGREDEDEEENVSEVGGVGGGGGGCVKEDMACQICFTKYGPDCVPVVGRCGHLICRGCGENVVKANDSLVKVFVCPTCRGRTNYPDLIRVILPGNVALKSNERRKAIRELEEVKNSELKVARSNVDRWRREISVRLEQIPSSLGSVSGSNAKSIGRVVQNVQLKSDLTNLSIVSGQLRRSVKELDRILFRLGSVKRKRGVLSTD